VKYIATHPLKDIEFVANVATIANLVLTASKFLAAANPEVLAAEAAVAAGEEVVGGMESVVESLAAEDSAATIVDDVGTSVRVTAQNAIDTAATVEARLQAVSRFANAIRSGDAEQIAEQIAEHGSTWRDFIRNTGDREYWNDLRAARSRFTRIATEAAERTGRSWRGAEEGVREYEMVSRELPGVPDTGLIEEGVSATEQIPAEVPRATIARLPESERPIRGGSKKRYNPWRTQKLPKFRGPYTGPGYDYPFDYEDWKRQNLPESEPVESYTSRRNDRWRARARDKGIGKWVKRDFDWHERNMPWSVTNAEYEPDNFEDMPRDEPYVPERANEWERNLPKMRKSYKRKFSNRNRGWQKYSWYRHSG
jgi:hypothetical protein